MRTARLVLLSSFALAFDSPRASAAAPSDPKQLGQQLDDREAATHVRRDPVAVDAQWSPELVVTNLFGTVLTRAQALERARKGLIQFSVMKRVVEHARREGVLLVTIGSEELTGAAGGVIPAGEKRTLRYTHVWREESGAWRLWIRHASIPAADPGAASERRP